MEDAVNLSSQKQMKRRRKFKLEVNEENLTPGRLAVKVYNGGAIKKLKNKEIKFFGAQVKGGRPTGQGVKPDREKYISPQTAVFWFNISDLIRKQQFTERTKEVILTADGKEIGRDVLLLRSAIYLG